MKASNALTGVMLAMLLSACATNKTMVRHTAAEDMGCDPKEISVVFVERPYVGVTRYNAEGCGLKRQYVCPKWYSIYAPIAQMNIPIGYASCKRDGVIARISSSAPALSVH